MPITPTGSEPTAYTVQFHVDGVYFQALILMPDASHTEVELDDAAQKLVDHLDGWADTGTITATKTRAEALSITPTP